MAKDAAKDSIRITNVYAFMFDIACKVSELSNVMVKCHGELPQSVRLFKASASQSNTHYYLCTYFTNRMR